MPTQSSLAAPSNTDNHAIGQKHAGENRFRKIPIFGNDTIMLILGFIEFPGSKANIANSGGTFRPSAIIKFASSATYTSPL